MVGLWRWGLVVGIFLTTSPMMGSGIPVNELLNMSAIISPQCKQAYQQILPDSLAWMEVNYASADVSSALAITVHKVIQAKGDTHEAMKGFSVSDAGSFDACLAIADQRYHFCDIRAAESPLIRWGVCLPKGCSGEDLMLIIPEFARPLFAVQCTKRTRREPSAAAYGMGAVILSLIVLSIMGTCLELLSRPGLPQLPFANVLGCFSALNAMRDLTVNRGGPLRFFDGFKALAMVHMIVGHGFIIPLLTLGFTNVGFMMQDWVVTFSGMLVRGGYLSVATFLFISGYLAVSQFCKHVHAKRSVDGAQATNKTVLRSIPWLYLLRWWRLAPTLAFVVGAYLALGPLLIEGPVTHLMEADLQQCRDGGWWKGLLFVSNLLVERMYQMCYFPSWYLDVDTQLWLTTPFFALLGMNNERAAYATGLLLIVASVVATVVQGIEHNFTLNLFMRNQYDVTEARWYMQTWARLPSFYVGCLAALAWFYHGERLQKALNTCSDTTRKSVTAAASLCVLVLLGLPIFGARGMLDLTQSWPQSKMVSFIALHEVSWAVGLTLLSALMLLRLGGPLHALLECQAFYVMSRLTFAAYLVHVALAIVLFANFVTPLHGSDLQLYTVAFGIAVVSYLMAAVVFLLVEMPSVQLSKLLFSNGGRRQEAKEKVPSDGSVTRMEDEACEGGVETKREEV